MKTIIPLALIAGGGYVLYSFLASPRENAGGSPDTSGSTPPANSSSDSIRAAVWAAIRAQNGADAQFPYEQTFDQWNYWYELGTRKRAPNWENAMPADSDRQRRLTFDLWRLAAGSGLGSLRWSLHV